MKNLRLHTKKEMIVLNLKTCRYKRVASNKKTRKQPKAASKSPRKPPSPVFVEETDPLRVLANRFASTSSPQKGKEKAWKAFVMEFVKDIMKKENADEMTLKQLVNIIKTDYGLDVTAPMKNVLKKQIKAFETDEDTASDVDTEHNPSAVVIKSKKKYCPKHSRKKNGGPCKCVEGFKPKKEPYTDADLVCDPEDELPDF